MRQGLQWHLKRPPHQDNKIKREEDMTKILTSHVGSLPRTQDVVDLIFAREMNILLIRPNLTMADACNETVRRHVEGHRYCVDGETSKISYATYVKDRYTGFSGDSSAECTR